MKKYLSLAALVLTCFTAPAIAQDTMLGEGDTNTDYLSVGVGVWDITQDDDMATDFRLEYRDGDSLFWEIKPWGGLEVTTDGSVWAGAGILADLNITPNIYIVPSFGVGLYAQGSNDKDLGSPLEFRSQLEGGYQFMNGHRLGLAFGHISNADIGSDNPGTEILNLYYHIPTDELF